jgi:hypothetical protein
MVETVLRLMKELKKYGSPIPATKPEIGVPFVPKVSFIHFGNQE